MDKLGYVPEENEHPVVYFDGCKMIVKSMDDRSIDKIDIILLNKEEKTEGEE